MDLICKQRAGLNTVCCRQLISILDEGQHSDQLIWEFSHLSLMNTFKKSETELAQIRKITVTCQFLSPLKIGRDMNHM